MYVGYENANTRMSYRVAKNRVICFCSKYAYVQAVRRDVVSDTHVETEPGELLVDASAHMFASCVACLHGTKTTGYKL